jgi:hypothetical protein
MQFQLRVASKELGGVVANVATNINCEPRTAPKQEGCHSNFLRYCGSTISLAAQETQAPF